MIRTQVLKHLQEAGKDEKGGSKGKMSGKERLPEERCRRIGMSGLLRGRSEEMTQSNTSSTQG